MSFVRRSLKLSQKDSLDVIEILTDLDILKPIYKIKLSEGFFQKEYETMRQLPSFIYDENLHEDIPVDLTKNIYIFFRVIIDE